MSRNLARSLWQEWRYASAVVKLATLIMILATVLTGVFYVNQVWSQHQRERQLEAAWDAWEQGDIAKAVRKVDPVLAAEPSNLSAAHLKARTLYREDPEHALAIYARLAELHDLTQHPKLALDYLEQAHRLGRTDLAGALIAELQASGHDSPDWQLANIRQLMLTGEVSAAIERFRDLTTQLEWSPERDLLHAELLLTNPMAIRQPTIIARLKAASNARMTGLTALQLLANHSQLVLFPDDRKWVIEHLSAHPMATTSDQLLVTTHRILLEPENREPLITRAVDGYWPADPMEVAHWLYGIGESEWLLTKLASWQIRDDPRHVRLYANALADAKQFDELSRYLASEQAIAHLQPELRKRLLQYVDQRDPRKRPPVTLPKSALLARHGADTARLERLARSMMQEDAGHIACEAYTLILQQNASPEVTQRQRQETAFRLYLETGFTQQAHTLATQLQERYPENRNFANSAAYLSLLLEQDPKAALASVGRFAEPHTDAMQATRVLGLIRSGEVDAASAVYAELPSSYRNNASTKLLEVMMAKHYGETQVATTLYDALAKDALLPQERYFIAKVMDDTETLQAMLPLP